jgi:F0F1-type ATP synthase membrane subunit b/b'
MEKDRVLNDIKKEVVDLSIVVAEKLIKKNMSEDDNEKLINETLRGLKGYEA